MDLAKAYAFFRAAGVFRATDFAQSAGISRQAALVHLRRAVVAGVLQLHGVGRTTRYALAPSDAPWHGVELFWVELQRRTKCVRYLKLSEIVGARCRWGRQANHALAGHLEAFWVIDFSGVTAVTEPFARGLVDQVRGSSSLVELVNVPPDIAVVLEQADKAWLLKPPAD